MTENTPGTWTDPALGSEGDSDQLTAEDSLQDRGVPDLLDEGYSPPERDPIQLQGGMTAQDPHTHRLHAELPEVWDCPPGQAPGERQEDRAPRLVQGQESGRDTDVFATGVGLAGGAASAEEAAMHIVEDDNDR
ncbi:MAG: DUF5709 domain-containing protein [Beutenbergiaceae bacterium]